eukprot:1897210-Karenia_brevis.AAC.1
MRRKRPTPVVICFNDAILSCEKGGKWQRVAPVPNEMRGERVKSDVISFNTAISACKKSGSSCMSLPETQGMDERCTVDSPPVHPEPPIA